MSFLRWAAAFFVLFPVGLHRCIQLCKIFADTFRAELVNGPARTGTGLQRRAVGVEHPPVSHSTSQCLLYDMVENLLKDITVIKAADAVLAEGGSIGDLLRQPHAQEPAVSHIDLDFLHQAAL